VIAVANVVAFFGPANLLAIFIIATWWLGRLTAIESVGWELKKTHIFSASMGRFFFTNHFFCMN